MLNWNIQNRILFYSLVPIAIIALLLAAFFISQNITESNLSLEDRGHTLARHLATASAHAVASKQPDKLTRILSTTMQEQDVLSATIVDVSGAVIKREQDPDLADPRKPAIKLTPDNNHLIFMQPILGADSDTSTPVEPITTINTVPAKVNNNDIIGWAIIEMSRATTHAEQIHTASRVILVTIGLMILSTMLVYLLSTRISSPLLELARAANEIEKGNVDIQIKSGARGELQILERSLNNIAVAFRQSRDQLQERVDKATDDLLNSLQIVERQNKELIEARQQALMASKVKSEFLANMSHEIRTPMNGILGFIKLLRKTSLNREQQDHLNTIEKSANNLLGIINDILDISKIEAGKIKLQGIDYNLRDCIEDVIALLAPSAHEKQLNLISMIYNDVPLNLQGDETKLRQIITNLVGNALKFTERGHIIIRTMLEDEYEDEIKIKISVTDTGIGISQKDMHRLFSTFEQIDPSSTRKFGGTGLGLAISKTLAELMQGEIGVESRVGQGSTFWFTFTHKKSITAKNETRKHSFINANPIRGYKALYYESSVETATATRHLLDNWGLTVTGVRMLPDLVREVQNSETLAPYDVLIIGLSHQECQAEPLDNIVSHIRSLTQTSILVLANCVEAKTLDKFHQIGAQQCLLKPVRYHDLFQALCNLLTPDLRLLSIGNEAGERSDENTPTTATSASRNLEGLHILVAEDHKINAKFISMLLNQLSAQVTLADDGDQAVACYEQGKFDLILMDVHMPNLNGVEATRLIRQKENNNQHVPIFALTADAMPDDQEEFMAAGMDEILVKPFDENRLLDAITKHIPRLQASGNSANVTVSTSVNSIPAADASITDTQVSAEGDTSIHTRNLSAQMYNTLIEELPEYRHQINEAFHNHEFTMLEEAAHKLHGHASYCNVPLLKSAVQQLERAARNGNVDVIRKCLVSVNDEIALLMQTASHI